MQTTRPFARPYDGVRILDSSWWLGTYAGRLFADLGAEVIRVEPPGGLPDRHGVNLDFDPAFAFLNAGKASVEIDAGTPQGRRELDGLLATSHAVLVERGTPLQREIASLHAANPRLVVAAITPWGLTGPMADAPASDLVLQAAGGLAWMSGRPDRPPLALPFGQAAMIASIYAAVVTAICLHDAETRGGGHLIDVSAQEAIAHSLQNAVQVWDLERRVSTRGGEGTRDAAEDIFPCRDGFVFVASPPSLGKAWKALLGFLQAHGDPAGAELSAPEWSDREWRMTADARTRFRALFSAFSARHDKAWLARAAIERGFVLAPVQRIPDLVEDAQLVHDAFFTRMAGPGGREIAFPGPPYRLSEKVWATGAAPALGADTARYVKGPA